MGTVRVNGATVDVRYIPLTVLWIVATIVLWVFAIWHYRRAMFHYKQNPQKRYAARVNAHMILALMVFLSFTAVDPGNIFFDGSGQVVLFGSLACIALLSTFFVYYAIGNAEVYTLQTKLVVPLWLSSARSRYTMGALVVHSVALIVQLSLDRVWLSTLVMFSVAMQNLLFGLFLLFLTHRIRKLTREAFESLKTLEISDPNLDRRRSAFRAYLRHSVFSACISVLCGTLLLYLSVPRFPFRPRSERYSNSPSFPAFASHRRFQTSFAPAWQIYVVPPLIAYAIFLQWVRCKDLQRSKSSISPVNKLFTSGSCNSGTFTSSEVVAGNECTPLAGMNAQVACAASTDTEPVSIKVPVPQRGAMFCEHGTSTNDVACSRKHSRALRTYGGSNSPRVEPSATITVVRPPLNPNP